VVPASVCRQSCSFKLSTNLKRDLSGDVSGMDLENLLGQIQPDRGNLLHGTAPYCGVARNDHVSTLMLS